MGDVITLLFPDMPNVGESLYRMLEITKPGEALVFLSYATALRRNGLYLSRMGFAESEVPLSCPRAKRDEEE